MEKKAKDHYDMLKETNSLQELVPKATGNWKKDKSWFVRYYEENIHIVEEYLANPNDILNDLDIDDEYGEIYIDIF